MCWVLSEYLWLMVQVSATQEHREQRCGHWSCELCQLAHSLQRHHPHFALRVHRVGQARHGTSILLLMWPSGHALTRCDGRSSGSTWTWRCITPKPTLLLVLTHPILPKSWAKYAFRSHSCASCILTGRLVSLLLLCPLLGRVHFQRQDGYPYVKRDVLHALFHHGQGLRRRPRGG